MRCIEPGHWVVGLNLYSDRELARGTKSIPVRVEVTGLNPQVTILFAGDVALDHVGQTINVISLDMDGDGKITPRDPPVEPVTDVYKGAKP